MVFLLKIKQGIQGGLFFFLTAVDFFSLNVSWGINFNSISVVSNTLGDDLTSDWVGITGGGENKYLSSFRNAWGGECRGAAGGVFSPSSKGSSYL